MTGSVCGGCDDDDGMVELCWGGDAGSSSFGGSGGATELCIGGGGVTGARGVELDVDEDERDI
jgi:hypothetical protein